ncbi:MAG: sulfatase [Bryobacterales bacterium]|nr:sulfatase [Bryobacterales bacterium]
MKSTLTRRALMAALPMAAARAQEQRPNILLMMADNWAWPHCGAGGDPAVKTPAFDQLAKEGVLFTHAFSPNPSCSPARSWLLTGQETHRLGTAASLYGALSSSFPTFVSLLEAAGYFVGHAGKGWGPGRPADGGYAQNPAGKQYPTFNAFLQARPKDKPFLFWFSSRDPHVPWTEGEKYRAGIDAAKIRVPAHLPDESAVREDIRNYYAEVQNFDTDCAELVGAVDRLGELDRTMVVMTGDNGWQMPRGLAACYDLGVRVPLAIRYPKAYRAGSKQDAFVILGDLCPTFLELAGVAIPKAVTAKSLLRPARRDAVFVERERHANVRRGNLAYPVRGIRTKGFLYLRNLEPDRYPAGDPEFYWSVGEFGDVDESPSKRLTMRDSGSKYYALSFGKRPAEELYELRTDPDQTRNVAGEPRLQKAKAELAARVDQWMKDTADPRAEGRTDFWDQAPYVGPKSRQGQKKQ